MCLAPNLSLNTAIMADTNILHLFILSCIYLYHWYNIGPPCSISSHKESNLARDKIMEVSSCLFKSSYTVAQKIQLIFNITCYLSNTCSSVANQNFYSMVVSYMIVGSSMSHLYNRDDGLHFVQT